MHTFIEIVKWPNVLENC